MNKRDLENGSPAPTSPSPEIDRLVDEIVRAGFASECAFLAELVKVPSNNPPGACMAHAQRTKRLLEEHGFAVESHLVPDALVSAAGMISVCNLVVRHRFGEDGPCVALNAHGDVVPPGNGWTHDPYGATIIDDPEHGRTMYGRGVAVSKSDFATYTFALLALKKLADGGLNLQGTVELHFTYDEETGGNIGPRWLLAQGLSRPDYAICAGFSYAVTTAHNGCLHLEVTVKGRIAHAAIPESGIDALEAATGILRRLYELRATLSAMRSNVAGIKHPTITVGLIEGGVNTNVVPDRVTFRIDRRIIPDESPEQAEWHLRNVIEGAAASFPDVQLEIRRVLLALPLTRQRGTDCLTRALQQYGETFFGCQIVEQAVPIYTDARHYAEAGIPTVLYGAGPRSLREANGHAANECLRLEDLRRATAAVAGAVTELLIKAK